MTVEIALLISLVSMAFSIYFGLKNSKRSDTKDVEERVKQNTTINLKLDGIAASVQDIKQEMSTIKTEIGNHNERLIKVEESIKSAHKRIDEMLKKIKEEE